MALEGAFPKIGGDILYASEANRFAYGFVSNGSLALSSGASLAEIGSVVINAGSLVSPCKFSWLLAHSGANGMNALGIEISGASSNGKLFVSGANPNWNITMWGAGIVGSPFHSFITTQASLINTEVIAPNVPDYLYGGDVHIGNLDVTQQTVIKILACAKASKSVTYDIRTFR